MKLREKFVTASNLRQDFGDKHRFGYNNEILEMLEQDMTLSEAMHLHAVDNFKLINRGYDVSENPPYHYNEIARHLILGILLFAENKEVSPLEYQGSPASNALADLIGFCITETMMSDRTPKLSTIRKKAKGEYKNLVENVQADENFFRTMLWLNQKETCVDLVGILERNQFTSTKVNDYTRNCASVYVLCNGVIPYRGRYYESSLDKSRLPSGSNGKSRFIEYKPNIKNEVNFILAGIDRLLIDIEIVSESYRNDKAHGGLNHDEAFLKAYFEGKTVRDLYKLITGQDYIPLNAPASTPEDNAPSLKEAA